MDKDGMVTSVKGEIEKWIKDAHPFAWNTGPAGRVLGQIDYAKFPEVAKSDFDAAVVELKSHVKSTVAGYSGREAASGSGTIAGYNIWSFLVEPWGDGKRKFNYHIKVAK